MNKKYNRFYFFSLLGILLASFYPIYMAVKVVKDMNIRGYVLEENYPKYIIPYTPISIALIVGVLLMPLIIKLAKKHSFLVVSILSLITFFVAELLLETQIIVSSSKLADWQAYMCYIPPDMTETRSWTPVNTLMGEYDPMWKMHFYIISVILILAILNCIYGFALMIKEENYKRLKALILQAVSSVLFLGLCLLACFTAFFRDGELTVSAISAVLMALFFIVMGVTSGLFAGSFLLGKLRSISIILPAILSAAITLLMYIGEMILLNGHLYSFGEGFFFEPLGAIVLAPVDLVIIVLSFAISGLIMTLLNRKEG